MSKTKAAPSKPPVEIFFDVRDSSYWFKVKGRYLQLGKSDLKLHLQRLGYRDLKHGGELVDGIDEIDIPFFDAMENRQIDYAGALAGHRIGIYRGGNNRNFLVTDEAFGPFDDIGKKAPEPKFFRAFIEELLPDQWHYFCHWLAIALHSLRRGDFRPGQVMVLVGKSGCGKSLLQQIITQVLGGRAANPFEYLMGNDKFNQDLVGSEHWAIVTEAEPEWFLLENVPAVPDIKVAGYTVQRFNLNARDCGVKQNRLRCFQFGSRDASRLVIDRTVTNGPVQPCCMASEGKRSTRRTFADFCELQGLPRDFLAESELSQSLKYLVVGNGVPIPMARVVARAINLRKVTQYAQLCICDCGRSVHPGQTLATAACRKRMERKRKRDAAGTVNAGPVTDHRGQSHLSL